MSVVGPVSSQERDAHTVTPFPLIDYGKRMIGSVRHFPCIILFIWRNVANLNFAKQCPPPETKKPTDAYFFVAMPDGSRRPNPVFLKDHFFREGRLTEAQALFILEETTEVLRKEPNLIEIGSPVTSAFPYCF
jgi:hypothetical protein